MTLGKLLRIVALFCIAASQPLAFLKYPWLPATVKEFIELRYDPAPWGTTSYHEAREARRVRVESALLLYCLGSLSLCGLSAIVVKVLPWWAESAAWFVTALTGLGISLFERPDIGPRTEAAYIIMAVDVPFGIAVIAAVAAVAIFASRPQCKSASTPTCT